MNGVVIGALMALSMAQQTDTVVAVGSATLLDVESMAGTIEVTVWDRNEVRIQAEHSRRTHIDVTIRGSRISVEPEAERGPSTRADFRITMPAGMDLKVEGYMVSITVDGVMGNVEAETLDGEVTVRGGRGNIKVASMSGSILVEDADGLIDVESAARDVRIRNSSGQIVGETMGGSLIFENVQASSVDVGSVGGVIWYDGTYDPRGTYFFGSHGGSVTLVVPEGTSAQFDLSTIHGTIRDNLSGEMMEADAREVHSLEVGGGGAIVEAETFGGTITVVRKGTEGAIPEARWSGDGLELAVLDGLGETISAGVSAAFSTGWVGPRAGGWSDERAAEWAESWSEGIAEHLERRFGDERPSRRRSGGGGI